MGRTTVLLSPTIGGTRYRAHRPDGPSSYAKPMVFQNELSGETVALGYITRSTNFDEFAPQAQNVIDTIEWGDS
jgi:hypothetical protein